MRTMDKNARDRQLGLNFFELGGEDPKTIPKVIPAGKERGGNELANVRRDADSFQLADYQIIQHEIDKRNENVAAGDLGLMAAQLGIGEDPVALQQIVDDPTDNVGRKFGPPQIPVKAFVGNEEN